MADRALWGHLSDAWELIYLGIKKNKQEAEGREDNGFGAYEWMKLREEQNKQ